MQFDLKILLKSREGGGQMGAKGQGQKWGWWVGGTMTQGETLGEEGSIMWQYQRYYIQHCALLE